MTDRKKKRRPSRHKDSNMVEQNKLIKKTLSRIKHKFLVMSGKGGVGKTSVAANLAVALSKRGARVGLMDVDLHGPDIPRMLGLPGIVDVDADGQFVPKPYSDNLEMVSIESMTEKVDEAVIWRGPVKAHTIRQFIYGVWWGRRDYLIVDSPPGTGDEPLTVAQIIPDAKAIIVTTPQEISLADVRKAIDFCRTVKMTIFGLVENMSGFICPRCSNRIDLFGIGGGYRMAIEMNIPFLARIPIDPRMVNCADAGRLYVENYPDSEATRAFGQIADKIMEEEESNAAMAS
jgi:Mrp family chromosome partitioning ATPase